MDTDLARRIHRLESIQQIRRLAWEYGQAVDARDLDRLANLYVEDYTDDTVLRARGREAVKKRLGAILRHFTTSMHLVGNQVIEIDDDDHARGVVYTRAEHEIGGQWVVMALHYWDTYERRNGRWYFKLRRPLRVYTAELLERPVGPLKDRWPGLPPAKAPLPDAYPSWGKFWKGLERDR